MEFWLFLAAAALIIIAVILFRLIRTIRLETVQVRRVRQTDLYQHVSRMLTRCNSEYVESVRINPERISIRMVVPLGQEVHYTFSRHGFDQPTPDTLYALAQAVSVDIVPLRSAASYAFLTHKETDPSGRELLWYEYMIRPHRKSELLRANMKKRRNGEDVPAAVEDPHEESFRREE